MSQLARFACILVLVVLALPANLAAQAEVSVPPTSTPLTPSDPATQQDQKTPVPQLGSFAPFVGKPVTAIEFTGLPIIDSALLMQSVPQKAGEPLDRNKLRQAFRQLYATGRFETITLHAEAAGDGVKLRFDLKPNFFIGAVYIIDPPRPPSANQLVNSTKLSLGEQLTPGLLDRAGERMLALMKEYGYYQAKVSFWEEYKHDTQQADIHFKVVQGEQARVGQVRVTGDPGYSEREIQNIAKMHPGDKISNDRVTRALQRLRNKYQKKDRLEAAVAITDRIYQPATNTLDYIFRINRGPKVDIHLQGADISRGRLKRYVPVFEENAVDEDLLNEGRRNLRDYFQTQGYFDVDIDWAERMSEPDQRVVVYDVDRGERHKLRTLIIEGNKYFDRETIRERMILQPASMLLAHGRFSQTMLNRDKEAIVALYQGNGFAQVKVDSIVEDDLEGEQGLMRVTVKIDEGPQQRVANLSLEGISPQEAETLLGRMNTAEGQPYSPINIATDRDTIVNYYFNRGYSEVRAEVFPEPLPNDPNSVNVRFVISEGRQTFVEDVLVSGLQFTRPAVIGRDLKVKPRDPMSQADMLDTQRRLYDLGIFNQVQVAVQNPEGDAARKNVLIQVEEAKRYTFTYGVGLEIDTGDAANSVVCDPEGDDDVLIPCSEVPEGSGADPADNRVRVSPRLVFDVTRLNFMGRDHTIVFKSRLSRVQQRVLGSYEAPRWMGRENWTMTFNTFYDLTRDVSTFTANRLEGSTQLEHRRNLADTFFYRFTYRRVRVEDLRVRSELVPLLTRPVRVGMPSFTFVRDNRDDPIQSTRGTLTSFDFGASSAIFGSEASFTRMLVQNSTYHAMRRKRWIVARATKIGIENPFGQSNDFIPLPERFFAGGSNTHRGFGINQAGPRDLTSGFPVGGGAMFINNVELRTPPLLLPFVEENLSAVLFHDAGNVFSNSGNVLRSLVRFSQPKACDSLSTAADCNFNYISHAIGAGVRYRTPIGPVRVDVGYNLNPPRFPVFSLNNNRVEQLGRINFYFSIGQTF